MNSSYENYQGTFIIEREILQVFFNLSEIKLNQLIHIYTYHYGESSARYAKKTYWKWQAGIVKPNGTTVERLIWSLPQVLDFNEKCDLLRKLRVGYCRPETHSLTVTPTNYRSQILPLAKRIIERARTANLPQYVESKLNWLASGDMQVAKSILAEAEVQEGLTALHLIHDEFTNIEILLQSLEGRGKIFHRIKLPYGIINLKIKRSGWMDRKNNDDSIPSDDKGLVQRQGQSLFRPSVSDIMDNALGNLDEQQVRNVSEQATREALRLEVERRQAQNRFENASKDMSNFIDNADLMDRRNRDFEMRGEYETASGKTSIRVSRQKTQTTVIVAVVVFIALLLIYFANR